MSKPFNPVLPPKEERGIDIKPCIVCGKVPKDGHYGPLAAGGECCRAHYLLWEFCYVCSQPYPSIDVVAVHGNERLRVRVHAECHDKFIAKAYGPERIDYDPDV